MRVLPREYRGARRLAYRLRRVGALEADAPRCDAVYARRPQTRIPVATAHIPSLGVGHDQYYFAKSQHPVNLTIFIIFEKIIDNLTYDIINHD